jgi:short-subunit dehydrogenase
MAEKHNATVHPLALDLTSPGAPQILFNEALQVFGVVHGLINNAGMTLYQEFHHTDLRFIHQMIALNLESLTELCHLFIPHMLAHGEPCHVVNVGSAAGYIPLYNQSVYTGTKHYVRIFTNMLHYEYRGTNISITALHPGGVLTESPQLAGQKLKKIARTNMMTPERAAKISYPAIMKGKRVIVLGGIYKLAALIGKLLPFPWAIRVTALIFKLSVEQTPNTHSY